MSKNKAIVNRDILNRAKMIRVINDDGEQLGVLDSESAIEFAKSRGLDIVMVAEDAKPPVCKLMNFGKFKYEKSKKVKEGKKKQHNVVMKEMTVRPKIEEHDYQVKTKKITKFLEKQFKVKVSVIFRGREMSFKEYGKKILDRMVVDLEEIASIEKLPEMEGRRMIMIFAPKVAK